ncbi:hypothetical protein DAEQUDRAFT_721660 [Daedalea quercina L-15889]|uniref:Uncharacterized protein n=1 Tax=Daedalea quercina L-15889 TaxID=1314783 RepID=A0A165TL40_9APHY|nr:hypothetical protein DAEQUDRAFT_721660 [Daedalea quercina L-15889]
MYTYASLELFSLRSVLPKCTMYLEPGKIAVALQSSRYEFISSFPALQGHSLEDSLGPVTICAIQQLVKNIRTVHRQSHV